MNDNAQALQSLLKVFDTTKIVSPSDIQAVLAGITRLLANFKLQNAALNADTKSQVDELLAKVQEAQAKWEEQAQATLQAVETAIHSKVDTKLSSALQQAQDLVDQAQAAMPMDGKDANPADVVPLVMEQIKLPENKPYILTGEDIVSALNNLPEDEMLKIDASKIKNLPLGRRNVLHGGFRNVQLFSSGTLIAKSLPFLKLTGAGQTATLNPDGSVTVNIASGGFTKLTATGAVNGVNTTFTFTQKPTYIISDGAWYVENSGWTWAGSTATMSVPPQTGIFGFV